MIDATETKEILKAEFEKHGLKVADVDSLLVDNRRRQDGRKASSKWYVPTLAHEKVGGRYYYSQYDIQMFIAEMVMFYDIEGKNSLPKITPILDFSLNETLNDFDNFATLELANNMTIYTGAIFGNPRTVLEISGKAYFLTNPTVKDSDEVVLTPVELTNEEKEKWGLNGK